MQIRRLGPADALSFRTLRLRALREHPDAFTSSYEDDRDQPVEAAAARLAGHAFWGAYQGSELYGIVGLERETRAKNRHKAAVVGMYVAPEVAGQGVGRYGSAQLADATLRPDGTLEPIRNYHGLFSLETHPQPKLDVYAYYGGEYAKRS